MIVKETSKNIQTSLLNQKEMSIKANGKSFKILAASLYKNVHSAVIRELSQNSADAHLKSKQTKPFEITLPTAFNPVMKFEDFGCGMSPEFVENEYLEVFNSSKSKNNKEIGGFGVGRIVLMSLTDSYILISFYNKIKHVYNIFINENGIPTLSKISEEKTDRENGVIIEFSVNQSDIYKLENSLNVLKWFPITPIVKKGDQIVNIEKIQKSDIYGENWYFANETNKPGVHCGCYFYELDYYNLGFNETQKNLLDSNIILEVPIGKVSVNASRESISWDDKTLNYIKDRLNDVLIEFHEKYSKLIAGAKTKWEASCIYSKLYYSPEIYHGRLRNIFNKLNLKWNGENLHYQWQIINYKDIDNPEFATDNTKSPKIRVPLLQRFEGFHYNGYDIERLNSLYLSKLNKYIFFYNDIKTTYYKERLREFARKNKDKSILFFDASNFDEFIKINNFEGAEFHKISSLPEPPKEIRTTTRTIYGKNNIFIFDENKPVSKNGKECFLTTDEKPKFFFLISNFYPDGSAYHLSIQKMQELVNLAKDLKIIDKNEKIFAIKFGFHNKNMSKMPQLIDFVKYVKQNLKPEMFNLDCLSSCSRQDFYNHGFLANLDENNYKDSLIKDSIILAKNIQKLISQFEENYKVYNRLKNFGMVNFDSSTNTKIMKVELKPILDKYPMLKYINSDVWGDKDVIEYLNSKN